MAGERNYSPYVIIGKLSRDFFLTEDGSNINDIPGGHLLYTAIGMSPLEKHPGLVARIGNSFPPGFLSLLKKNEFSTHGIKNINTELEHRHFISLYKTNSKKNVNSRTSVLTQYFEAGKPFPRELLGYNPRTNQKDSLRERTIGTVLARDIPSEYLEARCIHLCPLDYISHNLLPQAFAGADKRTITIHASDSYMDPGFYDAIKTLVNGLTAFIVREHSLQNLFFEKYRINDTADMMKILLEYGAENVIVKTQDNAYRFINRADNRILSIKTESDDNIIGSLSAFCGAHLVGYNQTYDYKNAVALGAARAEMLRNEWQPFNNLYVYEDLLMEKARLLENRIEG
ncbi:MAG: hypothetical protein IKP86_11170 [Anaerolineaceae bacterium]|nr:hypothetical protein [Anaerolineaceae bacterium]